MPKLLLRGECWRVLKEPERGEDSGSKNCWKTLSLSLSSQPFPQAGKTASKNKETVETPEPQTHPAKSLFALSSVMNEQVSKQEEQPWQVGILPAQVGRWAGKAIGRCKPEGWGGVGPVEKDKVSQSSAQVPVYIQT